MKKLILFLSFVALFLTYIGLAQNNEGLIPVTNNSDWIPIKQDFNFNDVTTSMVLVPAGDFGMGSDKGSDDEKAVHTQSFTNPFWIDEIEVTREAYGKCVSAGVCTDAPSNKYSSSPNQPINSVAWYQAATYCQWRDARLPTEREWEYAARGPDGLEYPWGNEFDEDKLHHSLNSNIETAPVGSYPDGASWVGALDMAGNVWEWASSLYKDYPYAADDRELAEDEENISEYVVRRGGSFRNVATEVFRSANRDANRAYFDDGGNGFRCVQQ